MALTLIRQANNYDLVNTYFPHDNKYPAIFQALSDEVGNYIDFKYIFSLLDSTGTVVTYETSPSIDSYGTFDATMYIKNKIDLEYNNLAGQDHQLVYEYRVYVQEYYNGAIQTIAKFNSSLLSLRKDNINRGQLIIPYTDITNVILTDGIGLEISQSRNTKGMMTALNYIDTAINYLVYYKNGINWLFIYNLTDTYSFTSDTTTALTDASDSGCTFPVGYADLLTGLTSVGYYDTGGTLHTDITQTGIESVPNATTPIKAEIYKSADATKYITFEYKDCNMNTLHWINFKGGFDLFNINIIEFHEIGNKKEFYNSEKTDVNLFNDNTKHNNNTIVTDDSYLITANTEYLTADEMIYLKSLYFSDKIYLDYEGEQLPVTLLNDKAIVKDTRGELQQYELKLLYAVN